MINLFNKKQEQEKKKVLSWNEISFIARNTQDINLKDKAGEILVSECAKNNDFYNLQSIMSDNNYSLKTQISAGEKYIEYLSSKPFHEQKELIEISACKGHIKENREKAGIKFIDNCVSQGYYSKLSEISKNSDYPLEVKNYAKNNFNLAIENCINEKLERIKQENFTFLLYFGENEDIPENMRTKVEESVKIAVETKLKSGCKNITPDYLFNLTERKYLSESFKNWAKKQGTEIVQEKVNKFYSQGDYRNLTNYSYWSWVPQEVQELSKKKLEELVIEMGKRL